MEKISEGQISKKRNIRANSEKVSDEDKKPDPTKKRNLLFNNQCDSDFETKRSASKLISPLNGSPSENKKNGLNPRGETMPILQLNFMKPPEQSSPRKLSISRFNRKQPAFNRGSLVKKRADKKPKETITLQDLLFRQKLDRFVKNMRTHSGLNDVNRLTAEKLMLINDIGASPSQILSEKAFAEIKKRNAEILKEKTSSHGRVKLYKRVKVQMKHLFHEYKYISRNCIKTAYLLLEENIPVFKPFGKFKIIWEIILLLLTIWNLISFSLIICFGIELQEAFSLSIPFLNDQDILLGFQIFCTIVYYFDIIIKFNTSIYCDGEPVYNRKKIFKAYCSSGLAFDILGTIPFLQSIRDVSNTSTKYLFFLLFKLYPLQVFFKNINEALLNIEGKLEAVYHLMKLFLTILTVCHIFACIWHYQAFAGLDSNKNWIYSQKLQDSSWSERYLRSLYFTIVTMTTVGYGDISPSNSMEYLVAMFCMLIGSGLIGYSINSIGAILKKKNKAEIDFRNKMQIINSYLKKNKIEETLKIRVRKYLEFVWKIENSSHDKKCEEILKELPNSLKEELLTQSRIWAMRNLFGDKFKHSTISKLVSNLSMTTYTKEEWIFQEGEYSEDNCLYIIAKGTVDLIYNEGKSTKTKFIKLSTKQAGDLIGVKSFILDNPRYCSAKAASVCTLFKLTKSKFLEIVKDNSEEYETYCSIRDSLFLYKNSSVICKKCYSCGDLDHDLSNCPQLTYKPFKNIIIRRHLYSKPQKRRRWKRVPKSKRKYSNTLWHAEEVRNALYDFQIDILPEISNLPEFYLNYFENSQMFPFQINNNEVLVQGDDVFTETRVKEESKEFLIASREDTNLLESNLKRLYENVPFKYTHQYQSESKETIEKTLTESITVLKNDEKSNSRIKKNHMVFFPLMPPKESPPKIEEDSKFDDLFKLQRDNMFPHSLKNIQEQQIMSHTPIRKPRDERKTTIIVGLRNPQPKNTIVKADGKSMAMDSDFRDDCDRTWRTTKNKLLIKKYLPPFDTEFDTAYTFSQYFPHNNKQNVIENINKKYLS